MSLTPIIAGIVISTILIIMIITTMLPVFDGITCPTNSTASVQCESVKSSVTTVLYILPIGIVGVAILAVFHIFSGFGDDDYKPPKVEKPKLVKAEVRPQPKPITATVQQIEHNVAKHLSPQRVPRGSRGLKANKFVIIGVIVGIALFAIVKFLGM